MRLIKAIIRPEKSSDVIGALFAAGFSALTKMDVSGCGEQQGVRIGSVFYSELPKDLLYIVCEDEDKDTIVRTIMEAARTDGGGTRGRTDFRFRDRGSLYHQHGRKRTLNAAFGGRIFRRTFR